MNNLPRHDPPGVSTDDWTLSVTGNVTRTLSLSPSDLRSFPLETYTGDFACEEGWVATDLTWRGVPIETILSRANPLEGSDFGLVRAMDGGYACAYPLRHLEESILATELDGSRLTPAHGGPARVVPKYGERDCWESVKWVTGIEVVEEYPRNEDTAKELALARIQ